MKLTTALLLTLIPLQSYAEQIIDLRSDPNYKGVYSISLSSFNDASKGKPQNSSMAVVTYKDINKAKDFYSILMASTEDGKQKIYLMDHTAKCTDIINDTASKAIIKILKQRIKVHDFCSIRGTHYYTPSTVAGENYMIKQFKTLKIVPVVFPSAYYPILFDATGFTKAWNNFGGDAI